jgi:hypothetical protein
MLTKPAAGASGETVAAGPVFGSRDPWYFTVCFGAQAVAASSAATVTIVSAARL